jgi:DNA transposition AAA+ family ATPase
MAISSETRIAVANDPPPSAEKVRAAAAEYMARAGMMPADLAAEVNYSPVTLRHFFCGTYATIASTDLYLRNALWGFLRAQPLPGMDDDLPAELLPTFDTRLLLERIDHAREEGYAIAIEGPAGTSKTVTLRWAAAERARQGKSDTFYLRAWTHITAVDLLKRFGGVTGAFTQTTRGRCLGNLARRLRARRPCVLLVDEAQRLIEYGLEPFEQLRDVMDEAKCGLLLAGHFSFMAELSNGLGRKVEQWLSRIPIQEHLRGIQPDELDLVATKFFGAQLDPATFALVKKAARAIDHNYLHRSRLTGQKFPKFYFSYRRLRFLARNVEKLRALPGNEHASLRGLIAAAAGKMMEAM